MTASRVVKVGGSLLDWPELPAALEQWLAAQPPALDILLCGGGPLTDAIRTADRRFQLGEAQAHWLCIDALAVSARLLAALLRSAPPCGDFRTLAVRARSGLPGRVIFDVGEFLRRHEPALPGTPIPHSWSATTDSIAARLASVLAADELVLLKSADPPAARAPVDWAAAGYVDAHFPVAAAGVGRVRAVNLRQRSAPEVVLACARAATRC
jgi:aspartokinase-like uncharacterized kinase